jgi:spermidine/putrescine-binding protein
VNVLVFSAYIPQDVLDDFRKETGIEPKVGNFASNEELLGKLRGGSADLDVVSPSDYMVRRLAALKLLRPLDRPSCRTWRTSTRTRSASRSTRPTPTRSRCSGA